MIALFALAGAALAPLPAGLPTWMAGRWCTQGRDAAVRTCELWRVSPAGTMTGVSRARRKGVTRVDERMAIRRAGAALVFHAEPRGQSPADFAAVRDARPRSVSFINPVHDYPQRVRYWRDGPLLKAEIAQRDGSRAVRWKYHAARAR